MNEWNVWTTVNNKRNVLYKQNNTSQQQTIPGAAGRQAGSY